MPYFARGEQSRQHPPRGAQAAFRALIGLGMLVTLLPLRQADAQAQTTDPANQVIFKHFDGTETPPQPVLTDCDGGNCDADSTEHKKPFGPTTQSAPAAGSRSDIVEIPDTEMWPNSSTVKLFSYWPAGETTACSGMLVDAKVVLTAASCIYSHDPALCTGSDSSCWVTDVSAVPAYTDGEAPYGRSGYESIMTWTAWTEGQNQAFDLAALRLRYPIGVTTGWLGVGFNTDNATFTENLLANSSYPQDAPYTGERMYGWDGVVTDADSSDDIFYLDGSCDTGRIGSSLYSAHDGITYGVFSHNDAASGIGITRITYAKFDSLRTFIQEGQPKENKKYFLPFWQH